MHKSQPYNCVYAAKITRIIKQVYIEKKTSLYLLCDD